MNIFNLFFKKRMNVFKSYTILKINIFQNINHLQNENL